MTFKELQVKIGEQVEADWTQHKNGGGWIHKNAKVEASCYIEGIIFSGTVSGDAQVYGDAQVSGDAQVYGDAQVSGDARVYGNARVYGDARVYGNARVYGDAQVSGDAQVYGDAQVSGDAWKKSPLFIVGSRFSLTNAKKGHIQIGCHCFTFADWKAKGPQLAKEHNFTKEEIEEYTAYIELFTKIGK